MKRSLSSKFWYHLLTMVLSILRKIFYVITKNNGKNLVWIFFWFFLLLPKWNTFIFWFSYLHYHDVEKCNFLTNDSTWFKNLTLAINYLFLFFGEGTSFLMNSFHLFLIFSLYVYMLLWVFSNKVFSLQLRSMIC